MKTVIQVTLNRNPYSFEVDAHERLSAYLAASAEALRNNPDREDILQDLEQAIADQCLRRLPAHASVIALAELAPALEEIGPVQSDSPSAETAAPSAGAAPRTRELEQISQGAWVSGVCLGLSKYLNAEVSLIRVIAAILLLVSGGTALVIYGVLMLLLPFAPLDPQKPAPGELSAWLRELVERLRAKLS